MYARRQEGLAKGIPFENELRSRQRDGEYRWFLWRYVPVRDERGQILRWYVTGCGLCAAVGDRPNPLEDHLSRCSRRLLDGSAIIHPLIAGNGAAIAKDEVTGQRENKAAWLELVSVPGRMLLMSSHKPMYSGLTTPFGYTKYKK